MARIDINTTLHNLQNRLNSLGGRNDIIIQRVPDVDAYIKNINYKKSKYHVTAEKFEDPSFMYGYFLSKPQDLRRGDWIRYCITTNVNGVKKTKYYLGGVVTWVDGMLDESLYKRDQKRYHTDDEYKAKVREYWTDTTSYDKPKFIRLCKIGDGKISWRVDLDKGNVSVWRCPKLSQKDRRDIIEGVDFYNKTVVENKDVVDTLVKRKMKLMAYDGKI